MIKRTRGQLWWVKMRWISVTRAAFSREGEVMRKLMGIISRAIMPMVEGRVWLSSERKFT